MILETSDGVHLFYEAVGDASAPAVLLLHGVGADHRMWQPQIERYPAEGYYVIVPDLRGHGESSRPEVFSIKDCARDMRELLAALGVERTHVAGVSMGGMVTQQFALDYPQYIQSLIIVDSLCGVTRPIERFNAALASALLAVLPAKMQTTMLESTYKRSGHAATGAYFAERLNSMDNAWVRHLRQQVNHFDVCDRLGEIHAPTLVLVGDQFGKMAVEMARTVAEGIDGAAFEVLPGGGDPSNLLVPDAFDRALLGFIRQVEAG